MASPWLVDLSPEGIYPYWAAWMVLSDPLRVQYFCVISTQSRHSREVVVMVEWQLPGLRSKVKPENASLKTANESPLSLSTPKMGPEKCG